MAKINFDNASERIAMLVKDFPRNEDNMVLSTEAQFDEIVRQIMGESTKAFAEALAKQTKKHSVNWKDGMIATYKYTYCNFKFI